MGCSEVNRLHLGLRSGAEVVERAGSKLDGLAVQIHQPQARLRLHLPDAADPRAASSGCLLNRLSQVGWCGEGEFVVITTRQNDVNNVS